jgi:tetratricopeptide (TPR) repeat protein
LQDKKTCVSLFFLKKNRIYILFLIAYCCFNLNAQQPDKVDSLFKALKTAQHDTIKLSILFDLAENIPDDSLWPIYNEQGYQLALKLIKSTNTFIQKRAKKGIARAYINFAYTAKNEENFAKALDLLNNSLKISQEVNDHLTSASVLTGIGDVYENMQNQNMAMNYYTRSLKLREKINDLSGVAYMLFNIAYIYSKQNDLEKAIDFYQKCYDKSVEANDEKIMADALSNVANIYNNQGNIPKAIDYWTKGLKIQERSGNKRGAAISLNNIGFVFSNLGDTTALSYFRKSLKLQKEIGDKRGEAYVLNNIGLVYANTNNIPKAIEYYTISIKLKEEIGDTYGLAGSYNNLGTISNKKGNYLEAINYFTKSLNLYKEISNKAGIALTYNSLASAYLRNSSTQKNSLPYKKIAMAYCDSSLVIAKEIGFPVSIRDAEHTHSRIDSALGNFTGAFEHFKRYVMYKDSINNEGTRKASVKSQLNYEFEKKEAIMKEQQEKERLVAKEKDRFQQIVIWSVVFGLLLVAGFAAFVFRSLKITKHQKHIIEEKQKEILDSIYYAKRIQSSLLPTEKYIERIINSSKK